jgi:hypothetical protein
VFAAASIGEGANGASLALAVPERVRPGNPQPDVDLMVAGTPLLGDPEPPEGNDVSLGGSLLPVSISDPGPDLTRDGPDAGGTGPPATPPLTTLPVLST